MFHKVILFFSTALLFVLSSSCVIGGAGSGGESGLSANIIIAAYSRDAHSSSIVPHYGRVGNVVCRPSPVDPIFLYQRINKLGISAKGFETLFGFNQEEFKSLSTQQTLNSRNLERTLRSVRVETGSTEPGENGWMELGFGFSNQSDYFLIINRIDYHAQYIYKNCEQFLASGTIDSSYCSELVTAQESGDSDSGEGLSLPVDASLPMLYFVAPQKNAHYRPLSKSPFENLTIALTGFQYVDFSNEPSSQFRRQQERLNQGNQQQQGQQGVDSNQNSQGETICLTPKIGDPLFFFPSYNIRLIFRGTFVNENGEYASSFLKTISLKNRPSRQGFYR